MIIPADKLEARKDIVGATVDADLQVPQTTTASKRSPIEQWVRFLTVRVWKSAANETVHKAKMVDYSVITL